MLSSSDSSNNPVDMVVDQYGRTALMNAVLKLDPNTVDKLIEAGASKKIQDKNGETALIIAIKRHIDIFDNCACTPHELKRKIKVVELLSNGDIEYLDTKNKDDMTALMFAVKFDYIELTETLVRAGASLNIIGEFGWTAIMWAVNNKDILSVKYLIQVGASLVILDEYNYSVLMRAVIGRDLSIIELLIENRAQLDTQNDCGKTAIEIALKQLSYENGLDVVEILLYCGANLSQDTITKYPECLDIIDRSSVSYLGKEIINRYPICLDIYNRSLVLCFFKILYHKFIFLDIISIGELVKVIMKEGISIDDIMDFFL
jgi:ankyrin repeat protein